MNYCELVTFVSSFSCLLGQCLTDDEVQLLGVLFTQLGDSLATISVVKGLTSDCECTNTNTN